MQERPMLLLMIYENDTHKSLTNEATVPRVRHWAVKFKTLSVTNSKEKVSLLGNKRNWNEVLCGAVSWSTISSRIDPAVELRLFHIVFNGIHFRVADEHGRSSDPCIPNSLLSFCSETQTKLVSLLSEIRKSAPICTLTLLNNSPGIL